MAKRLVNKDRFEAAALDRHITGNYGEDSVSEYCEDCGEHPDDCTCEFERCDECDGIAGECDCEEEQA